MKLFASLVLTAAVATLAAPAHAQFAKAEDAIKYRQAAFTLMGAHFGRVAAMASGRAPFDPASAASNAAIAESISKLPYTAFIDGSDKGSTDARPEIWTNRAKFNADAEKMQGEMTKLAQVAKGGNLDAIKTQVGATGAACKACHDDFRKK